LTLPGLVYTSPTKFNTKEKLALFFIPPVVSVCLKALVHSCRTETRNIEAWRKLQEKQGWSIVAIWHESLGLAACCYQNTGYHTLTSYSFDGELAARVVRRFGLWAVRGSSSRGGSQALVQLEKALQHVHVGFTLDGPLGPRRVAKPGVAILSARTGAPVIPHAFAVTPCWRLNSWDRLPVPKPFSRIVCAYGAPIPPPPNCSPDAIEAMRERVERELNQLHTNIEAELGICVD